MKPKADEIALVKNLYIIKKGFRLAFLGLS